MAEKEVIIDFNELSKLGLIAEINNKILHPQTNNDFFFFIT